MSDLSFPETAESDIMELENVSDASIQNPHYQEYLKLRDKEWTFSDLLPMNIEKTILTNNEQKIKVLNLLYHCYRAASQALQAFYIDKNPDLFDAHVGECACQIRAIKLAVMLKEMREEDCEQAQIQANAFKRFAMTISTLIEQYHTGSMPLDGHMLLSSFVKKYDLNCGIKSDHLFLLVLFVLRAFKERVTIDKIRINLDLLSKAWNIAKNRSDIFITRIQKIASFFSVYFVLSYDSLDLLNARLLSRALQKDHIGRWMLPCLETTQHMLDLINRHTFTILLEVFIEGRNGFKLMYQYFCKNNFFLSMKTI
jgi:hypothetical protein